MDCNQVRQFLVSMELLANLAIRHLEAGDTKTVDIMLDGIEQDIKSCRKEMEGFTNV